MASLKRLLQMPPTRCPTTKAKVKEDWIGSGPLAAG
jgi:hypothetical protein